MTSQKIPVSSDMHTDAPNQTVPDGCISIRFSEWDYLPWNNPDNIVSREVAQYSAIIRTNALVILFLIGCPANVINMAVFVKQGLKDRVNLLLFSLSLADEVCLIGALVHVADEFYLQFTGELRLSRYRVFIVNNHVVFLYAFSQVSFFLSAVIACERCYCVLQPLKYPTLVRTRTTAFLIAAVYVVIPGVFFFVTFRYHLACVRDADSGVATNLFVNSGVYRRYKVLIDNLDNWVFGAGVLCVMMMVLVTATTITIVTLRKTVAWRTETTSITTTTVVARSSSTSSSPSVSAKEVALTKMLVGTSLLLIVCMFPGSLTRLASLYVPEFNNMRRLQNFYHTCIRLTHVFYYLNSTLNVFVYYRMGSRYRETFRSLFRNRDKR